METVNLMLEFMDINIVHLIISHVTVGDRIGYTSFSLISQALFMQVYAMDDNMIWV